MTTPNPTTYPEAVAFTSFVETAITADPRLLKELFHWSKAPKDFFVSAIGSPMLRVKLKSDGDNQDFVEAKLLTQEFTREALVGTSADKLSAYQDVSSIRKELLAWTTTAAFSSLSQEDLKALAGKTLQVEAWFQDSDGGFTVRAIDLEV